MTTSRAASSPSAGVTSDALAPSSPPSPGQGTAGPDSLGDRGAADLAGQAGSMPHRQDAAEPLQPTAILRPNTGSGSGNGHATTGADLPGVAGRLFGQGAPPPPRALVSSVGEITGLSPRRRRGDGGEVAGHDVDRVDALEPAAWHAAVTWLQDQETAETRRTYLACLSWFLAWLNTLDTSRRPAGLLTATEDHLKAYKDDALNGRLRHGVRKPGTPLSANTVAKRITALRSFFQYAHRRRATGHNPAMYVEPPPIPRKGRTFPLSKAEAGQLRDGLRELAKSRPDAAAAVAILAGLGTRSGSLPTLTVGDIRMLTDFDGRRHLTVSFRNKGGTEEMLPLPKLAAELLAPLLTSRAASDLLFSKPDGRPIDRWWVRDALRQAAPLGGIPAERSAKLYPHMLRSTFITHAFALGIAPDKVQQAARHANLATTMRYNHPDQDLGGHAAYQLEADLAGQEKTPRT
ncbi:tyrosine-type recombinase/integrase [Nonomuraea sp. KM90]|uniref:tyrosine-type recombinase/integrase n=1 Tax=Nonomuraea sp. KM90 TaxID=3457428 RepID=UPI003FCD1FBE